MLAGALRAEAQVGLKMNVPVARLQEVMKRDITKWTKVVKTANIRVAQ